MNELLLAAVLGVVEGVTEFLPVSSTAHLRIAQSFLGLSLEDEFWKLFAVFIQLGAILAVMVYYRTRLKDFTADGLKLLGSPARFLKHPAGLILIAFVCTAVPAFLLKKIIGKNLESLYLMAGSLFVGGVIMMLVDYVFRKGRVDSVEAMKPWQAVFIGLVQILSAVFPGTSRSMSTIAAGQVAGLTRTAALDFSFFVSIPIMIVATLYDLLKYVKETGGDVGLSGMQIADLAVGFVVSFVVAYGVVAWFLRYVRKHGFFWFGVYRILAAAILLYTLTPAATVARTYTGNAILTLENNAASDSNVRVRLCEQEAIVERLVPGERKELSFPVKKDCHFSVQAQVGGVSHQSDFGYVTHGLGAAYRLSIKEAGPEVL